ncbi:hypothetical protein [Bdellovibrio sp. NC01]|uniref:hypothetical protein n=1 Tax=Bdellovibrio sp. NC01 TaxID=2220073 RepID=UPI00115AC232|nr:hypothetical protein [Bdellovibrio sp. NC01]QDK39278.1 hypothetical protein DOE51_17615 [Bdellovibrio sp. NC01]
MKSLFTTLMFLSGLSAQASILEVNKQESKVYFTVTPTLQLNLVDLDSDGGMLTVFLDYRGNDIKNESLQLNAQYPNYAIQAVIAHPVSDTVDLEIPAANLKKTLKVSQGQTGPYLNSQIMLTVSQVKKIKELRNFLKDQVNFQMPIRASYFSQQVLETVTVDESACGGESVKSVKDVINNLANFKKPASVKNERTFSSLKQDLLDKCYGISPAQINSFADLMKQPVIKEHPANLSGVYVDSVAQDKSAILSTNFDLQLN